MRKKLLKQVSLALIIALLVGVLPQGAISAIADTISPAKEPSQEFASNKDSSPYVIGEIIEKRELCAKYFRMGDGSITVATYTYPIHFEENGALKDIDNSFTDVLDKEGKPVLSNKQNSIDVKFQKKFNDSKLMSLKYKGKELNVNIDKANKSISAKKVTAKNTDEKASTENPENNTLTTKNKDKFTITNLNNTVKYDRVFDKIDISYTAGAGKVKENIIVNGPTNQDNITYTYEIGDLKPKQTDERTIDLLDENGEIAYQITAPVMWDSNDIPSESLSLKIKENNCKKIKIVLTWDKKWVNDEERSYPVIIDPVITDGNTIKTLENIKETYVEADRPTTNDQRGLPYMKVGNRTWSNEKNIYIRFLNLPPLQSGDRIVDAELSLAPYYFWDPNSTTDNANSFSPIPTINAYRVTSNWALSSETAGPDKPVLTWNTRPSNDSTIIDYEKVNTNTVGTWGITKVVQDWYQNPAANYGMVLKTDAPTASSWFFYYATSDSMPVELFPTIVMQYRNTSGIEDYWTYHSQSAGRAGEGFVNDYTGNLVWSNTITSMSGSRMPASVSLFYNTNYKNDNYYSVGYGWWLSCYENLLWETNPQLSANYPIVYWDADRTRHHFVPNGTNKYIDEDGLGLNFEFFPSNPAESKFTLTDKKGNKKIFDDSGWLRKVLDANGNYYDVNYITVNNKKRVSSLVGAGGTISFSYFADANLNYIEDTAGRKTYFEMYYNRLTKITYPDGRYINYAYDGNYLEYNYYGQCLLTKAIDIDGSYINYNYTSYSPYRISAYSEKKDANTGTYVDITYNHNETVFTENSDSTRIFTYQFNNWGHTVCIKDAQGNAQYYEQGTSGGSTNKTTMTSKMQKTTTNLLKNHNFEMSGEWYESTDGLQSGSRSIVTEDHYNIGTKSAKFVNNDSDYGLSGYHQYVSFKPNTSYVLSAYVKMTAYTDNGLGGGALLFISSPNGQVLSSGENVIRSAESNEWKRISLSYTTGNDVSVCYVIVGVWNARGTAYFDCVQLEEAGTPKIETPSRYNILENGGLESWSGTTPMYWSTWLTNSNDTTCSTVRPYSAGTSSYKVTGESDKNKNIYREYVYSGSAGDNFVFGSWAKADSVPTQYGRSEFKVVLCLNYDDGTQGWFGVDFNYGTNQWQFASSNAIATKSYNRITMWLCYYQNANTAYFDDAFLYKEEFGQSYQYDANGNIKSTADLAKQESTFANDNNNLSKLVNPEGSHYNYTYDEHNNVTSAKTSDGSKYSFTYDGYGNPLSSKVESKQDHQDLVVGQIYRIKSKNSGLYLDAFGPAPGFPNGNDVGQWKYSGCENQKWKVISGSNGYYKLMNIYNTIGPNFDNGKVIDIDSGYNTDGAKVQMWENISGNPNQDLKFIKNEDGSYNIRTRCSNETKSLDVNAASTQTGEKVHQWTTHTGAHQQWFFEPVNDAPVKVDRVTSGNTYYLKNVNSGLYLHASAYANASVQQNTFNMSANEQWIITDEGTNGYSLRNAATSDQYLAVLNDSNTNATQTQIEPKIGGAFQPSQYWKIKKNLDGTFRISSNISSDDKSLVVYMSGTTPFTNVVIYPFGNYKNEEWILEAVTTPTTSINTSATYTSNGNYLNTVTDARGKSTSYNYNSTKGTLDYVTDAKGKTTNYAYNVNTDALESISKNVTINGQLQTFINNYEYLNDRLDKIKHNNNQVVYSFGYDWAGNNTTVDVGTQNLITNQYNIPKGLLTRSTYGNGHYIDFSYDEQDRVIEKKYNNNSATSFKYVYNNNGNLGILKDFVNNNTITYTYDLIDRLTKISQTNGLSLFYSYDSKNRLSEQTFKLNGITNKTGYIYGDQKALNNSRGYRDEKAGLIYGITVNGTQRVAYEYDFLNRLSSRTLNTTNPFTTKYDFIAGDGANTTTTLLQSIQNGSNSAISYTYDDNGNIETISEGGVEKVRYTYDQLNQLVREDSVYQNQTITYDYDLGGNITYKKYYAYTTGTLGVCLGTSSYAYEDNNWKDKLTSWDGYAITYDAIGNMVKNEAYWLRYNWQNGRQLSSLKYIVDPNDPSLDEEISSYKYNDNGIRTQKIYNGVTTNYYLNGDSIAAELRSDGVRLDYFYDENGNLFGFNYTNPNVANNADDGMYYYIRNGQNDIIGILDSNGNQVVSYTYDSWGIWLGDSGSKTYTVGNDNPFRYRGYYMDIETGFYYLNSRYYDPYICRFLNADGQFNDEDSLIGANLFAYCDNNPVVFYDPSGYSKTYVFYYNGKSTMKEFAMNSAYFNSKDKNVVMVEVNTAEKFIEEWNKMTDAGTVYLYLHGGEGVLYFSNTMRFTGANSFSQLQSKKANMVYLFACHGGSGTEGNNVAWMFSKLTGANVRATTSGVSFTKVGRSFQARVEKANFWKLSSGWGTYYYQKKNIFWGNNVAKSFRTTRKWAI